ncbi:MAG: methyltransferase domain-containing protein [Pirellulales bacterium]|nr:methyltransferase domain-containing protein [Pirellulales bacterium]
MDWDPKRYLQFGDYRTRPAADLLARIPLDAPPRVVDLGCGPGNSTRLLVERWPQAQVTGVDASAEMLTSARSADDLRGVCWIESTAEAWTPDAPPDVIFSNAMLQYVADHARFFPKLLAALAPGGVLAIQIPYRMPGQKWVNELHAVAGEAPWREKFDTLYWGRPDAAPAEYYNYLASQAEQVDVWMTEYLHVLEGDDPVLRWTRGTAMLPFLMRLEESERPEFEARYAERLRAAYPRRDDGRTLFPFVRLFLVARARGN